MSFLDYFITPEGLEELGPETVDEKVDSYLKDIEENDGKEEDEPKITNMKEKIETMKRAFTGQKGRKLRMLHGIETMT